jgi:hypothetical protein
LLLHLLHQSDEHRNDGLQLFSAFAQLLLLREIQLVDNVALRNQMCGWLAYLARARTGTDHCPLTTAH